MVVVGEDDNSGSARYEGKKLLWLYCLSRMAILSAEEAEFRDAEKLSPPGIDLEKS
jgi:hypothetical protein